MRNHAGWDVGYRAIGVGYWLAGSAYLLLGAALETDIAWVKSDAAWLEPVVSPLQKVAPLAIVGLSAFIGTGKLVRGRMGDPWAWQAIHFVLDHLQRLAFSDSELQADPPHHHRVTLFRGVGLRRLPFLPWWRVNWLVPYERSGTTTRSKVPAFRVSDNPEDAEGIAGQTWVQRRVLVVDVPELSERLGQASVEEVAKKSFITPQFVQDHRPKARSYCGIPIECRGRQWGVLVFDSRAEQAIQKQKAYLEFTVVAGMLGKFIERASR